MLLQGNETFYSCFSNQKGDEYRYTEIKRQCNSNAALRGLLVSDSATAAASKESVRNIVVDVLSQMQSNEKSEYNNTKNKYGVEQVEEQAIPQCIILEFPDILISLTQYLWEIQFKIALL